MGEFNFFSTVFHCRITGGKCTTILILVMDLRDQMQMLKTTAPVVMAGEDGGIEVCFA